MKTNIRTKLGMVAAAAAILAAAQGVADVHSIRIGLTSSFTGPAASYREEQRCGWESPASRTV